MCTCVSCLFTAAGTSTADEGNGKATASSSTAAEEEEDDFQPAKKRFRTPIVSHIPFN